MESAKAFVERIKTDQEFASKMNQCKNPEEFKDYIAKAGFNFTQEEVSMVNNILEDDQLEEILGGFGGAGINPMLDVAVAGIKRGNHIA